MPSGRSRTGLRIPKTPGSRRTGEDIAWIGRCKCNGDAARKAARMPRHLLNQERTLLAKPQSHTTNQTAGTRLGVFGATANRGAVAGGAKGWPICCITNENCAGGAAGAVRQSN